MLVYFAYSSNYQTLRISGTGYPSGTYKGTFDGAVDPTEGGTVVWRGPFNPHASQIRNVIIEDDIYLDYANNLFDNFVNCTSIQGVPHIKGNLLNTTRMFANTPNVTQPITLSNLISINCLDATEMFAGSGSREIVLDNINMKNCTSTKGMFKNAKAEIIEMTSINTNSVRYSQEMFQGCTNLQNIYATNGYFDFSAAINSTNMFDGAKLLPNWDNMGLDKRGAIPVDNGGYINMSPYSLEMVDVRIQLKYDTKEAWLDYDPVPLAGEMCIESDTNRFKVGDGAHHYSQLPYMYGFKTDNRTIIEDSETFELKVPIDEDTIFVGADGKVKAKQQVSVDGITILQTSEGMLYLDIDNSTIKVNGDGQLEAEVKTDERTIIESADGLTVPIDNNTVFVDTDGKIKSRSSLTPGQGLEWNVTEPNKLDVKLGRTLDYIATGADPGINVNFDGQTIYWDETTGPNGALRAMEVKSADGMVTVTPSAGHYYDLTLPIDDDTIKFEGGVIKATAQVPEVDDQTIKLVDNKLTVPIDSETIYIDGGKLKAKQTEIKVDGKTIIINSEEELEAIDLFEAGSGIKIEEDGDKKIISVDGVVPKIDGKTIIFNSNSELSVNIDNDTIIYNSEDNWLEVPNQVLNVENGIYARESEGELYIGVNVDNKTIFINDLGQVEGAPNVLVDDKTIIIDSENIISVNIDNDTIVYNSEEDFIEVPHQILETEKGIYTRETSEGIAIGVNVDEKTIFINADGQLEGAPNVIVDNRTIVKNSEDVISVPIDENTIVYNDSEKWIEVDGIDIEGENGIYIRGGSEEKIYIGANVDNETVFINAVGQIEAKPGVEIDERTIVENSEGKIEVAYDHNTIVFDETERWLEVDGVEIVPIAPIYINENSETKQLFLGCGYDNTTITLNEKNELQTAVGGGWRRDPEEKIIATGTNVPKHRHHMLPDDDADYFLETVWFPNPFAEGKTIQATVTHDAAFMDSEITLTYMPDWDVWYYDGRHWDSEGSHPLNPHGYSVYVQRNKTVVQLHEDFEIDPDTLTCTIKYGGHNLTKEFIDNQFVKVDNETVYVNSEGELAAALQLKAGKWIVISEGVVEMGKLCQGLAYNEESNCIYVKDATDSEVGGVKIDNETLKVNEDGQLAFDLDGMLDRGLDASTGKIGHTNEFVGDLRQAGDPTSTLGIKWDNYGHLQEVERYDIPSYLGATAYTDGRRGLVPAAGSAQRKSFLRGDGTWSSLVDSNLFSVIQSSGQWYVGTDRRSRVFSAEPSANQLVIAPLGWTIDRETEGIDVVYATEMTLGHTTLVARSNSQAETVVRATCYWLVLNM